MPRRHLQFICGGYYHIYNRGASRTSIFRTDQNYGYCLHLLRDYSRRFQVSVIAYCLMPNHYHWLVRQDGDIPAGLLPTRVWKAYSNSFNAHSERTGALFEGPYQALAVTRDEYLRHLCRYIHANPVRHGFCAKPEEWTYSNYQEWTGMRGGTLVDNVFVQEHFDAGQDYAAYVASYLCGEVILPKELDKHLAKLE